MYLYSASEHRLSLFNTLKKEVVKLQISEQIGIIIHKILDFEGTDCELFKQSNTKM